MLLVYMSPIKLIMNQVKIGGIFTINQEETMEKVKQEAKRIWGLAQAYPKGAIATVVIIIAIYFLAT